MEEADPLIYEFCIENQTVGDLGTLDSDEAFTSLMRFGDYETAVQNESGITIINQFFFRDDPASYLFIVVDPTSSNEALTSEFIKLLPFALAVILVVSSAAAWICSRWFVRPLQELSHISQRMAQLDMTWECNDKHTDEVGILARNLNSMRKRLKKTMDELEEVNRHLASEVEAVTALEKDRRDFFMAVSHELKTPLAVLKAQLESMNLNIGDYANHGKYLPETLQSVETIEHLVVEILLIVKLESQWGRDAVEDVRIVDVVERCLDNSALLIEQKGLSVSREIPEEVTVKTYHRLVNLVLSNLITNAILHSPDKTLVTIQLVGSTLLIQNRSDLITDEDLRKMFEPFYRLDSSRSRDTGGSGLGLYVVETVLKMIEWCYQAYYQEGVFTFEVELPSLLASDRIPASPDDTST